MILRSEILRSSDNEKFNLKYTTINLKSDVMFVTSSLHVKFNINNVKEFTFSLIMTCDKFN